MAGAGGLAAAALALVRRPSQGPLLYVLLFLQFAAAAFYDPARKALLPLTVRGEDLHLATTIDSFAWSLTGALGATAGGVLASRLGNTACFLVDAATYAAAAACALQLPRALGDPGAAARQLHKTRSCLGAGGSGEGGGEVELAAGGPPQEVVVLAQAAGAAGGDARVPASGGSGVQHHQRRQPGEGEGGFGGGGGGSRAASVASHRPESAGSQHRPPHCGTASGAAGAAAGSGGGHGSSWAAAQQGRYAGYHKESDAAEIEVAQEEQDEAGSVPGDEQEEEEEGLLPRHRRHPAGPAPASAGTAGSGAAGGSSLAAAAEAWREGLRAFWEGWTYLLSRDNRDVAGGLDPWSGASYYGHGIVESVQWDFPLDICGCGFTAGLLLERSPGGHQVLWQPDLGPRRHHCRHVSWMGLPVGLGLCAPCPGPTCMWVRLAPLPRPAQV